MRDQDRLARFVDAIRGADSLHAMFGPLRRELEDLGFQHMHYKTMRSMAADTRPLTFLSTYPAGWIDRYISQRYELYDPVVARCRRAVAPFLWHDAAHGQRLAHQEAQVMGEAGEFGMRAGGLTPVHSPGGTGWAFISVTNDMDPAEFAKLFAATAPLLTQYAAYLQEAFPLRPDGDTAASLLTPRQADLLSWMARGKTRDQAAAIVGIADSTAKDHLRRACLRLKAVNTTQAVAIAASRGWLCL